MEEFLIALEKNHIKVPYDSFEIYMHNERKHKFEKDAQKGLSEQNENCKAGEVDDEK